MRVRNLLLLVPLLFVACADQIEDGITAPGEASFARQGGGIPSRQAERAGTALDVSDPALWEQITASGGVAAVGLKAPGAARGVYRGQVLVDRPQWRNARNAVLNRPGVTLVAADELLPIIEIRIADIKTMQQIRRLPMVDYLEPVLGAQDLDPVASVGGCGYGRVWASELPQFGEDFYSEKFAAMRIPEAWTVSSGEGVLIASIDTGVSPHQDQLGTAFSTGAVTSRWVQATQIPGLDSPNDRCGHGTRMAGLIAAPLDGQSVVGVAWGANLLSIRHSDGVANVSSTGARRSVRLAAQNEARVVSMAWQSMNWFWQVSDEIKYWYYRRPILFVAAAGTSGCWDLIPDNNVVFPAEMSEVIAVTGISYTTGTIPCGIHYGRQVELVAFLDVPTTGQFSGDIVSVGGSSNATGIVAGIAALAWSREPGLSRDQLRQRLQQSGSRFPVRDSRMGFGLLDAVKAVGGLPDPPEPLSDEDPQLEQLAT